MKENVSVEVEKDLNNNKFPIKIINIDFFEIYFPANRGTCGSAQSVKDCKGLMGVLVFT